MLSALIPRREQRHLLPFSSVMLNAEISDAHHTQRGYLWDISSSGACLCFNHSADDFRCGEPASIRFYSPDKQQSIQVECTIIWMNSVHGALFVGIALNEALDLGTTFFQELLNPRYRQEQPSQILESD